MFVIYLHKDPFSLRSCVNNIIALNFEHPTPVEFFSRLAGHGTALF